MSNIEFIGMESLYKQQGEVCVYIFCRFGKNVFFLHFLSLHQHFGLVRRTEIGILLYIENLLFFQKSFLQFVSDCKIQEGKYRFEK